MLTGNRGNYASFTVIVDYTIILVLTTVTASAYVNATSPTWQNSPLNCGWLYLMIFQYFVLAIVFHRLWIVDFEVTQAGEVDIVGGSPFCQATPPITFRFLKTARQLASYNIISDRKSTQLTWYC